MAREIRELFGDERQDYAAALKRNEQRPATDWADRNISSYASVHPWEDWAECWAHYLHIVDSLDTALEYGLRGEDVESAVEHFSVSDLYDPDAPDAKRVVLLVNSWVQLTMVLNDLRGAWDSTTSTPSSCRTECCANCTSFK